MDCEPEAGRARPPLCPQRRVRQQSRASGTVCGTQDCILVPSCPVCGPGHALSLTAHLSAPQFRNFKIIYRRYAGLYFCICVDVNDNNLAYLEAIHNFVEVHGLGAGGRQAPSGSPLLECGALSLGEGTLSFFAHLDVSSGVCFPSVSLCLVYLLIYFACNGP